MRILVASDIHGNSFALSALMEQLCQERHTKADVVRCLGDVFGYFTNPIEAWQTISALDPQMRLGNHDAYIRAMLVENRDGLGPKENDIVAWTNLMHAAQVKSSSEHATITSYLEREDPFLPRIELVDGYALIYVHGSLVESLSPYDYTYTYLHPSIDHGNRTNLITTMARAMRYTEIPPDYPILVLVGHTHSPMIAYLDQGKLRFHGGRWSTRRTDAPIDLKPLFQHSRVVVVNGGAVGEPRAGAAQARSAHWAVFDTETGLLRLFSHTIKGVVLDSLINAMRDWKQLTLPDEVLTGIRRWYLIKSGGQATDPYYRKAESSDSALHVEWQSIVEALLNRYLDLQEIKSTILTDAYHYTSEGFFTR